MTGFLHPPDALDEMADERAEAADRREPATANGQAACRRVREQFCAERVVPMYERCYEDAEIPT